MTYIAKPVEVEAHKITAIDPHHRKKLVCTLENGAKFTATAEMIARFTPVVGDYVVIQPDGYTYLNPKDVFERKYGAKQG